MKTVHSLLKQKPAEIFSIAPEHTVFDALGLMMDKNISALVVKDNSGRLVGIVTERDYARKVALQGRASRGTAVRDIMEPHPVTVSPQHSIEDCMEIMTRSRIRHLPVIEANSLLGLISIGDIVKHLMEEQKSTIEQLQSYISS